MLEERLKHDVLSELAQFNAVLVTREEPDGQLRDVWLSSDAATPTIVQTPREVYAQLAAEGLSVSYLRVPITHNRVLKARDLDTLQSRISCSPAGTRHVFNCQMGRGRTTMAMCAACICLRASRPSLGVQLEGSAGALSGAGMSGQRDLLLDGQWLVVSRLLRLLPCGAQAKRDLDTVVDLCEGVVNLRKAILEGHSHEGLLRHKGLATLSSALSHDKMQAGALEKGVESLDRYVALIAFAAWARVGCPLTFKAWRASRPEIQQLRQFVRQQPLAALEYSSPVDGESVFGADAKLAIAHRCGTVLCPWTLLLQHFLVGSVKMVPSAVHEDDATWSMEDEPPSSISQDMPRLCRAVGLSSRIVSFASPSRGALISFLEDDMDVGPDGTGPDVHIIDVREELVLYIDDLPYTLREVSPALSSY